VSCTVDAIDKIVVYRKRGIQMEKLILSEKAKLTRPSAIHGMSALAARLPDSVALSWARPDAPTPQHINDAAIRAINSGLVSKYSPPPGVPKLREEITKKLQKDNGIEADVQEILITTGSIEGAFAAVLVLIDPGDEVLMPSPNYSTHALMVKMASGVPVYFPTVEEEGFRLDFDALEKAITDKTKMILYCNPCNPTGAVFPEEDLRKLADIALRNNLWIVADEAYEQFVFDGRDHFCIGSIPEMKGRVIENFTFTKTYAMTGWRIGFNYASKELIEEVIKAHTPMTICAPVVSQYAALEALRGPQDCIREFHSHYLEWRDLMCDRLDNLPSVFSYQKPLGSYNMFPKIVADGGDDSVGFCMKLLKEAKVATTPGKPFGPTGEGHLRMSFCSSREVINEAFDRMDEYFRS
jgi:aminotransferase